MSMGLLGNVGGVLAIIGVIACPITSGDTAFRSARLTIADWFKIDQTKIPNRLYLAVPLLGIGYLISLVDYQVVWRYFSWSNQTLAMMVLWAGSVYLAKYAKLNKPISSLIAALPATFMSAVSCTYILYAEEGFHLSTSIAYPIGLIFAAVCLALFLFRTFIPALKARRA
jgi:carbon starvation protein CstA